MFELSTSSLLLFSTLPLLLIFFINCYKSILTNNRSPNKLIPNSYPLIGSLPAIFANQYRTSQWTSDVIRSTPTSTFILHRPLGICQVYTANITNVHHILKTHFHIYRKGDIFRTTLFDLLGNGIFNADGNNWKSQRQICGQEFNTNSLRHFVEHVVDTELNHRLIPLLATAAGDKTAELDLQDVLQRFSFDNICKIAFGYDPGSLLPSLPRADFVIAFEDAVQISFERFLSIHPLIWKAKRFLNVGSEKHLRVAVTRVREFAKEVVKKKKREFLLEESSRDLLSRFLSFSDDSDENLAVDIVVNFIFAGRDSTSAALTWLFWLISRHPEVEVEILKEINGKCSVSETTLGYDVVKDMVYTHASICESMRLYPPVPIDSKEAVEDDILPDGTVVKKGMMVGYHPYAMGRAEELWGADWAEFRPERWLETDAGEGKWVFRGRDQYEYPVFQAGPRVCLGKEMAFLQMKRVVAGILKRFRFVPAMEEGVEPKYVSYLTSKMEGGFPVQIEERTASVY